MNDELPYIIVGAIVGFIVLICGIVGVYVVLHEQGLEQIEKIKQAELEQKKQAEIERKKEEELEKEFNRRTELGYRAYLAEIERKKEEVQIAVSAPQPYVQQNTTYHPSYKTYHDDSCNTATNVASSLATSIGMGIY